nr:MAG TPA: hypothetical protein [Caudoviricetes sp.]DAX10821.1 MAG TPA: hypothetical protein [Bacteriophage sp.]
MLRITESQRCKDWHITLIKLLSSATDDRFEPNIVVYAVP